MPREVVQEDKASYRFAYSSVPSKTELHTVMLQFLPLTLFLLRSGFLATTAPKTSITISHFTAAPLLPISPIFWLAHLLSFL